MNRRLQVQWVNGRSGIGAFLTIGGAYRACCSAESFFPGLEVHEYESIEAEAGQFAATSAEAERGMGNDRAGAHRSRCTEIPQ